MASLSISEVRINDRENLSLVLYFLWLSHEPTIGVSRKQERVGGSWSARQERTHIPRGVTITTSTLRISAQWNV